VAKRTAPKAKLLEDGTLLLFGTIGDEFDGLTAARVIEEIRSLGDVAELEVLVNSPGGVVHEGLAIYNELATHPANVTVTVSGLAASMASAIAMAGNRIRMARNGMLMIHNPWNVAVGDKDDLRKAADVLEKFGTSLVRIYAERTGLELDEVQAMMDTETWLDADEALAKGFVDEIVEPVEASAFADLDVSELVAVPAALTTLIREGKTMGKVTDTPPPAPAPAPAPAAPAPVAVVPDATINAAAQAAVVAERERTDAIQAIADRHGLDSKWVRAQVSTGATLEAARGAALAALEARQSGGPSPIPGGVGVTADETEKFIAGATAALIQRAAGQAQTYEKFYGHKPEPGEFRGMSLLDLAKESLHRRGISTRGLSKMEIAGVALGRMQHPRGEAGLNTRSDFSVLLENVLNKSLLAAYGTTPDTWSRFCAVGSVSDFRPHPRLRIGHFSALDALLESGEFKQKHIPDAKKESISATTRGNVVGLTRQAIVNDDVDGFQRVVANLGRAARLSIETEVYALLALNSNLGPTMNDGLSLFHATHLNVGTGAALSAAAIDADRVVLSSMKDPESNEILDLRPAVLLIPVSLGGQARVINESQYDPDTVANKAQMKANAVVGLFRDVVDTPRLSGTRRYLFADPAIAPCIEVVFLEGQSSPVLETEEGFDYDGVKWRVRFDFGVGATDFRGAVTNAGV